MSNVTKKQTVEEYLGPPDLEVKVNSSNKRPNNLTAILYHLSTHLDSTDLITNLCDQYMTKQTKHKKNNHITHNIHVQSKGC